jgi:hypothetical protein
MWVNLSSSSGFKNELGFYLSGAQIINRLGNKQAFWPESFTKRLTYFF